MENPVIKNGLFYALASVLISLLLWMVNKALLFNTVVGILVGLALPIIFMIMANRERRDQQEGYLSFGEGIVTSLGTYAIGSFVGIVFTWVLINYIDPSLIELQQKVTMEASEKMLEMFGGNEEMIEEMREKLEEDMINPTLGQNLFGWAVSLLFPGLLFALIVAAITKKGN